MLYLASQSPQRATLLRQASLAFTVVASVCDEDTIAAADPAALAVARACGKAQGALAVPPGALVLGADTVVALGAEILGNPADPREAGAMLARLSGSRHHVHTGHCLWRVGGGVRSLVASATVAMRQLSAAEIATYAASGEGVGKAGGYALQAGADRFARLLDGDFDTVVGLHLAAVRTLLANPPA